MTETLTLKWQPDKSASGIDLETGHYEILDADEFLVAVAPEDVANLLNILTATKEGQEWMEDRDEAPIVVAVEAGLPRVSSPSERYKELLACWRNAGQGGLKEGHCSIIDSNTFWEGERWTELHQNGDTMTVGTMTVPLNTQFLVCPEHTPKEALEG